MKKNYFIGLFSLVAILLAGIAVPLQAQQLPDPGFEDWSGDKFEGNIQPKYWHGSNVSQSVMNVNFTERKTGHNGYCVYIADKDVKFASIGATSPGYVTLGTPWSWLSGLNISSATAGTYGGISFTYRPDAMKVWIKRTGSNTSKENYNIVFYSWKGTAKGSSYKSNGYTCSSPGSPYNTDEESDIRIALNKNMCATSTPGKQIAEGWVREKKTYNDWTQITVPIYYLNNDVPEKVNVIFSAGNYPNFRDNNGIYNGNDIYIDDVELVYNSNIEALFIDGIEWTGFDGTNTGEQVYSLGSEATEVPEIYGVRGRGTLTNDPPTHDGFANDYNEMKKTVNFPGRRLSDSEMTVQKGKIGEVTTITVKAEDGSSTTTYKIRFVKAVSSNATPQNIVYTLGGETKSIGFSGTNLTYNVSLPYGTTDIPQLKATLQSGQTVSYQQPTKNNLTGKVTVTAADGTTKKTYTVNFTIEKLTDNTLQDILVNGVSLPGFSATGSRFKYALSSAEVPTVTPVSAYPAGEQTINIVYNTVEQGCKIEVSAPGNTTVRTYTITYTIEQSGNTYLTDLRVEGYDIGFNQTTTSYTVNLPLDATALPQVTYVAGDSQQTIAVDVTGMNGLTGVYKIVVTSGKGTTRTYRITFTQEQSSIKTLKAIFVNGQALADFAPTKTTYEYELPEGTTSATITWTKGDEYQTVRLQQETVNVNGRNIIIVTAGNGETQQYIVTLSVRKSEANTLRMIYIDGNELDGFSSNVYEYNIQLPVGTTQLPVVTYDNGGSLWPKVTISDLTNNGVGDYRLTVTAETGARNTYVLHFSVTASDNTSLSMIYLDGVQLEGFAATTTEYDINLPVGVTRLPQVTAYKAEASQRVAVQTTGDNTVITVTAASGVKQTYTLRFHRQMSANALLNMIYLDGDSLPGFDKNTLEYTVTLADGNRPVVTVDKDETQQTTIQTSMGYGTTTIIVTPQTGTGNTYLIHFVPEEKTEHRLKSILVDGVEIEGFDPAKKDYTYTYNTTTQPSVTYVAREGQSVRQLQSGNLVTIVVTTVSQTVTYTVTLIQGTVTLSNDATLTNIMLAAGTLTPAFSAEQTAYTVTLAATDAMPVVTYEAKAGQTIAAGFTSETVYTIHVRAEDGQTEKTYTVTFNREAGVCVAPLLDMIYISGNPLDGFVSDRTVYSVVWGADKLPIVTVDKPEGTSLLISQTGERQHTVLLSNDCGETAYVLNYAAVVHNSPLLSDIRLNAVLTPFFAPTTYSYVVNLPAGTKAVPCITPVEGEGGQIITVAYGRINSDTKIHVLSESGAEQDYVVHFNVPLSNSPLLAGIYVDDMLVDGFDPSTATYTVLLDAGTSDAPKVTWRKYVSGQQVDFTCRPVGEESVIKVTSEDGSQQQEYKLRIINVAKQTNQLQSITITGAGEVTLGAELNKTVSLPFGTTDFTITGYQKNYAEQTVMIQNGGILRPTIITVYSNNAEVAPVVYTLTPEVATVAGAVLNGITIDGTPIAGFDKEQFSYIVNIEDAIPVVEAIAPAGVTVTPGATTSIKKRTFKVEKDGETNTYTVHFYYKNDVIPNQDFTIWEPALVKTSALSPKGWMVPADCTDDFSWIGFLANPYVVGNEVQQFTYNNETCVKLSTIRDGARNAIYGSVPGMMTIGTMSVVLAAANGSTSSVSGNISFKNTPDRIYMDFNALSQKNMNNWRMLLTLGDGSKTDTTFYTGPFNQLGQWRVMNRKINYGKLSGEVKTLNILVNAAQSENSSDIGGLTERTSELLIKNLHFIFNSTLKSVTVDGNPATISGTAITYDIADAEYHQMPVVRFRGEVDDQMPVLTWTQPGVTANIRNYAEDGSYTDYTLTINRPQSTVCTLADIKINGNTITGFNAATTEYTYSVSNWTGILPDIEAVPASVHEIITMTRSGNQITITVAAENGDEKTYTITFVDSQAGNSYLQNLFVSEGGVLSPAFASGVTDYTILLDDNVLPVVHFVPASMSQTVEMRGNIITVTSQDSTQEIYTLTPVLSTSGLLSSIEADNAELTGFDPEKYVYDVATRPTSYCFTRAYSTDSVFQTITDKQATLAVFGEENQPVYTIRLSASASDNSLLQMIRVDGVDIAGFTPDNFYPVTSAYADAVVEVIPQEAEQTVSMTSQMSGNDRIYTIVVTSPDGNHTSTYTLTLQKQLSNNANLIDIFIGGQSVGLVPGEYTYSYEVALADLTKPKTQNPDMPDVTYSAHRGQTVALTLGTLTTPTLIDVTAEDDVTTQTYVLNITSQKSHYAYLSDITVAGVPVPDFKPQTNSYTMLDVEAGVGRNDIQTYTADLFQKEVEITGSENTWYITSTAEDGTQFTYTVIFVRRVLSSDAQLYDIHLDNLTFTDFAQAGKGEVTPSVFRGATTQYTVTLPQGTTVLPDVSTIAKNDKQVVSAPEWNGNKVTVDVTAEDGTVVTYEITFTVLLSKNTDLLGINVGDQPVAGFNSKQLFYQVTLDQSIRQYQPVEAVLAENVQRVDIQTSDNLSTIIVTAEDTLYQKTYIVQQILTPSSADTLTMIYADGIEIEGFEPNVFVYNTTLTGCNPQFPHLDAIGAGEPYQNVKVETIYEVADSAACYQITVLAENGSHNNYILNYTVAHSAVDTLQAIYVGGQLLENFSGSRNDYQITLERGTAELPEITWLTGDECMQQDVQIEKGGVNGLTKLIVTAPAGNTRVYTISFSTRLSDNALLKSISVGGIEIDGYDQETFEYAQDILYGYASLPLVTFEKQEEAQSVTIVSDSLSVTLNVVAEDGITTASYKVTFNVIMSDNSYLLTVYFDGERYYDFRRDIFEYHIPVDYTVEERPQITWLEDDTLQTVMLESLTPLAAKLTVYAPNKEDFNEYLFYFDRELCHINRLEGITLRGEPLAGFAQDSLEYVVNWPVETPVDSLYTVADVDFVKAEKHEAVEVTVDSENTIVLRVQAENGDVRNYLIQQTVALSDVAYLVDILVGGVSLNDFDSARFEYTYVLLEGEIIPEIEAVAPNDDIQVSVTVGTVEEPTNIYCIAPNGRRVVYSIRFEYSETNVADRATSRDVLLRHIPGSRQFMAYATRQNVQIALYDHLGTQLELLMIPVCNPNLTVMGEDTSEQEFIYNVMDSANGVVFEIPEDNMPYYYVFYYNYEERLSSGKIMMSK